MEDVLATQPIQNIEKLLQYFTYRFEQLVQYTIYNKVLERTVTFSPVEYMCCSRIDCCTVKVFTCVLVLKELAMSVLEYRLVLSLFK